MFIPLGAGVPQTQMLHVQAELHQAVSPLTLPHAPWNPFRGWHAGDGPHSLHLSQVGLPFQIVPICCFPLGEPKGPGAPG